MRSTILLAAAALALPGIASAQTTGGTAGGTMGQPGGSTMGQTGTMGQQPGTMGQTDPTGQPGTTMGDPTRPSTSTMNPMTTDTTTTTRRSSRTQRDRATGPDAVTNSRTTLGQPAQGQPTEPTNSPPDAMQPGPRS